MAPYDEPVVVRTPVADLADLLEDIPATPESPAELSTLDLPAADADATVAPSTSGSQDAETGDGAGKFSGSLKGLLLLNLGAALFGSNQVGNWCNLQLPVMLLATLTILQAMVSDGWCSIFPGSYQGR